MLCALRAVYTNNTDQQRYTWYTRWGPFWFGQKSGIGRDSGNGRASVVVAVATFVLNNIHTTSGDGSLCCDALLSTTREPNARKNRTLHTNTNTSTQSVSVVPVLHFHSHHLPALFHVLPVCEVSILQILFYHPQQLPSVSSLYPPFQLK